MVNASQLRAGMAISYQGQDYRVIAADYHPGQGKMGGATHARLQNIATGTFWEHSFRPELKLEEIPFARQTLEFLYSDGDVYYFMNPDTFEQAEVPKAAVAPQVAFLEAGMKFGVGAADGGLG